MMRFGKTKEDPLDYDAVIIDEASMIDLMLMNGLVNAIRPGTRLIIVGDADQLPSVGAGNVLRDIISSELIYFTRLTEIFRQAGESMIVVNAHRINILIAMLKIRTFSCSEEAPKKRCWPQ